MLDSFTYTYNADGIRTSKTVYGITYEYILNGSQPIGMRWTESGTEYLMLFIYDDTGSPIALKYRTSAYAVGVFDTYFFEKNLQGDIIAIYDEVGTQIGTYKYTAWGSVSWSCASGTSAFEYSLVYNLNPFRYRGYIYDFETGLYYLQSRYYNPAWGRFLNADDSLYSSFFGYNLYTYCDNDPVNYIDPFGRDGTAVLAWWLSGASWVPLVDGPIPAGDIIFLIGTVVCVAIAAESSGPSIEAFPLPDVKPLPSVETFPVETPSSNVEEMPTIPATPQVESIPIEIPTIYIETFSNVAKNISILERGGKENVKHTKYRHLTDTQVIELFKNPATSKAEKRDLQTELKGRKIRNQSKRKENY